MRKAFSLFIISLLVVACGVEPPTTDGFLKVDGHDIVKPNGEKFFIQGTNLGNWLNPEGYMFFFGDRAASYRMINDAFCELVGPEFTKKFWNEFKENYITEGDIKFIRETGMNSIRIPFHYKLFTNEDYMGMDSDHNGFELIDRVVEWCRENELYIILDMHDAPGGQTGDNIDDSYGYPWLMECEDSQQLFCDIWQDIAKHYAQDTIILGYDLINEPIAHYFTDNLDELNNALEPLYKRCTEAIREVDKNHIILLGGAQWNGNFTMLNDHTFDDNMMYTCHRYWCDTLQNNIQDLVDFRDRVNLPMYMGETGENSNEWVAGWTRLMERNNIGWHYWPYKKMVRQAGMSIIPTPENWNLLVEYTREDRSSFSKIREVRPDEKLVRKAMLDLLENMKFENCEVNSGYIEAMGMQP